MTGADVRQQQLIASGAIVPGGVSSWTWERGSVGPAWRAVPTLRLDVWAQKAARKEAAKPTDAWWVRKGEGESNERPQRRARRARDDVS
jgi:hypothetical protein